MCERFTEQSDVVDEEDAAMRKIFSECNVSPSFSSSSPSSSSSLSSSSTSGSAAVPTLIEYIRENVPTRVETDLLEELRESLHEVSTDGRVTWRQFQEASRRWFAKLRRLQCEDDGDNLREDQSDVPTTNSDGGESFSENHDSGDIVVTREKRRLSKHGRSVDFVDLSEESNCNPSSTNILECDTTNSALEITADKEMVDVAEVDLVLRVRRFDEENSVLREENAGLREEVVRMEELNASFEHQIDSLRRKLNQASEKCKQLQKENDEQKEMLREVQEDARTSKSSLQKMEKSRATLARQLEAVEKENQNIAVLSEKLERITSEKVNCSKQAAKCYERLEAKQVECETLQEKISRLEEANTALQDTYENTSRHLQDNIEELKSEIAHMQMRHSNNCVFDRLSLTPPRGSIDAALLHSTPCRGQKIQPQDSLRAELKASGFPVDDNKDDFRIHELEKELSWYNDEIQGALEDLEKVARNLAASSKEANESVSNSALMERSPMSDIMTLKGKIALLSDMVADVTRKKQGRDFSTQVTADSLKIKRLKELDIPSFEDRLLLLRERKKEGIGEAEVALPEVTSMTSQFANDSKEENPFLAVNAAAATCSAGSVAPVGLPEHTIIGPIVAALDKIIDGATSEESSPRESIAECNSKCKSRYTYTLPSSRLSPDTETNPSNLTTSPGSPNNRPNDTASVEVSSAGDGDSCSKVDSSKGSSYNSEIRERSKLEPNSSEFQPGNSRIFSFLEEGRPSNGDGSGAEKHRNRRRCLAPHELRLNLQRLNLSPIHTDSPTIASTNDAESSDKSTSNVREDVESLPAPMDSQQSNYSYCETPKTAPSVLKRKISVFQRSFDINTLYEEVEDKENAKEFYGNASMSTPTVGLGKRCNGKDDLRSLKPTFLCTYRSATNDSESSDSPSPFERDLSSDLPTEDYELASSRVGSTYSLSSSDNKISQALDEVASDKVSARCRFQGVDADDESSSHGGHIRFRFASPKLNVCNFTRDYRKSENHKQNGEQPFFSCARQSSTSPVAKSGLPVRVNDIGEPGNKKETTMAVDSPRRSAQISDKESKEHPTSDQRTAKEINSSTPLASVAPSAEANGSEKMVSDATNGASPTEGCDGSGGGSGDAGCRNSSMDPAVALAMSSGDDSSDSECGRIASGDEHRRVAPPFSASEEDVFRGKRGSPPPTNGLPASDENHESGGCPGTPKPERLSPERQSTTRTLSETESNDNEPEEVCRCRGSCDVSFNLQLQEDKENDQPKAFPSLTDARLQESGIATLSDADTFGQSLSEEELEKKYTCLSMGLTTDRVTLSRRMALSLRQRDQTEHNFDCEVQKMQQDVQALAPLCIDRESVERVERVRHQLEMIARCARRVSCTAETLGAVHQEHRISRAALLADRYLQVLRARCEKLAVDLAETKRILMENNIVFEESPGEMGDDVPRVRYRGVPVNNRTMEIARQRNSVSGRMSLRRPSLSYDTQKWDGDKLDRTDSSSSSIGELREIFEQAESRRNSKEENNNLIRSQSSNFSVGSCESADSDVWSSPREEIVSELPVDENITYPESEFCLRTTHVLRTMQANVTRVPIFWCILLSFFLGFYVQQVVSSMNSCSSIPNKWWSIEEILRKYIKVVNVGRPPI